MISQALSAALSDYKFMPIRIVNAQKRKPGQRAGMSRSRIVATATKLWVAGGPDDFTIRKLARNLKVGPTTVRAHFKEGLGDLRREIARKALSELTPPYQPKQGPKDYLRTFLRSSLASFREKPHLGRLVASELTNDPLFSLVFAERMGATFLALDKNADLISALELFVARWAGLLQIEIGAWGRQDPDEAKTRLQVQLVPVSTTEYPTLKAAPQKLGVTLHKRAQPTYLEQAADIATAAFLSDLAKRIA
jgi:AcrR family transcriptional regulator